MAKSTRSSPGARFTRALILTASLIGISTSAYAQLTNGSFELPKLADGQTAEPFPNGYGWVVNGSVALTRDAAYLTGVPYRIEAPLGRQWALVRTGTSISQPITLAAGQYYVSINAMQMTSTSTPPVLRVTVNG